MKNHTNGTKRPSSSRGTISRAERLPPITPTATAVEKRAHGQTQCPSNTVRTRGISVRPSVSLTRESWEPHRSRMPCQAQQRFIDPSPTSDFGHWHMERGIVTSTEYHTQDIAISFPNKPSFKKRSKSLVWDHHHGRQAATTAPPYHDRVPSPPGWFLLSADCRTRSRRVVVVVLEPIRGSRRRGPFSNPIHNQNNHKNNNTPTNHNLTHSLAYPFFA